MKPPGRRPKKTKSLFRYRLEQIQSLSLDAVAAEVDRKRLKELHVSLAAPSARERQVKRRLVKLYEEGQLSELPSYLRANARRMQAVLIALHWRFGKFGAGVIKIERLAAEAGIKHDTAERGVRDLVDACLVAADRRRKRLRQGGQGPNLYQIVYSTIADLALSQGVQATLFDEAGRPPDHVNGQMEAGRPPGPSADLPPPGAGAPPHCAGAPPHCAGAPPHKPVANARARAVSSPSFQPSPSPARSEDDLSRSRPSVDAAEDLPIESAREKEKDFLDHEQWEEAAIALEAYGVYFARAAVAGARAHGWTAGQVLGLLERCYEKTVGDVQAWGPALVFRHLQQTPAGSPILTPPRTEYVRALRDRELVLERRRADQAAERAEAAASSTADERNRLESLFGAMLDALSPADRDELVEALCRTPFDRKWYRSSAGNAAAQTRQQLLQELERRSLATKPFSTE